MTNKEKIKNLKKAVAIIKEEILKLAGHKPACYPFFSDVGNWSCEDSPCGLCCYDHYKDPVHDKCVFCGEPEERK